MCFVLLSVTFFVCCQVQYYYNEGYGVFGGSLMKLCCINSEDSKEYDIFVSRSPSEISNLFHFICHIQSHVFSGSLKASVSLINRK